ncbi:MAG: chemotaxis protein CheV [Phycisphaerae bacterium]|nr:chemotaxis protein CheV [Phycisphaerae bacterium]
MNQSGEKQEILLESGTNELEILVFSCGPTRYGVNVAKVREVIGQVKVVDVPMTHPAVIGVFKLRNLVIPLVDLQLYFEPEAPSTAAQRNVILMEFNNCQVGFLVDDVDRIFRMSWGNVKPMPMTHGDDNATITSVCEVEGGLALMIDFEKIAFDLSGDQDLFRSVDGFAGADPAQRGAQRVLLAEDSPTICGVIKSNLIQAGYTQVVAFGNGSEAWSALEASVASEDTDPFSLVVTDIEMPQMDGLHLCKRIKEHPRLRELPVVVFSSLVSDTNLKKCEVVGADAAITKPQIGKLVGLLDKLLITSSAPNHSDKAELMVVAG